MITNESGCTFNYAALKSNKEHQYFLDLQVSHSSHISKYHVDDAQALRFRSKYRKIISHQPLPSIAQPPTGRSGAAAEPIKISN
jgi:hypothetical protein